MSIFIRPTAFLALGLCIAATPARAPLAPSGAPGPSRPAGARLDGPGDRGPLRLVAHTPTAAPAGFEENRGQIAGPTRFVGRAGGVTLRLDPGGADIVLPGRAPEGAPLAVRLTAAGGNPRARLDGIGRLPGVTHDLRGPDPAGWVRDIASYSEVVYRDLYPGIDLAFRAAAGTFEYDLILAPGADPGRVRLAFDGADRARLDRDGDLLLDTPAGTLRQRPPRVLAITGAAGGARQAERDEARAEQNTIGGAFTLLGAHLVGFRVAGHAAARGLVIDPVFDFSTFSGGCRGDQPLEDVTTDGAGDLYVAGESPWDCDRGPADLKVQKFDPQGGLLFTTRLGGQFEDRAKGIALDAQGDIYLTGWTNSNGCCRPFPVVGALQAANAGGIDAFVIELDPLGRTILYATFLGGSGDDRGNDIRVDDAGRIYVAGRTTSADFPIASAWQGALAGPSDAFLAVLRPGGAALAFSTYLGGAGDETAARLALSPAGPVVAGSTSSADFPTRSAAPGGPFQAAFGGGPSDAYVATFSPDGTLLESSYLGGSGTDEAYGVAIDAAGALVTGRTDSPDFPLANAPQPALSFPPDPDAFLALVPPVASSLSFSTYLQVPVVAACGSTLAGDSPCGGVAADGQGRAFVTASGVFVIAVDAAAGARLYSANGYGGRAIAWSPGFDPAAPRLIVAGTTGDFLYPTVDAVEPARQWYETTVGTVAQMTDAPNPDAEYQESDPRLSWTGAWEAVAEADASGGAEARSMQPGAAVTIIFEGTGLQVFGRRDEASGRAAVSVDQDPNLQGLIRETYAAPSEPRALLLSISGLAPGTHQVRLQVDGTRDARSAGNWVHVDGIRVLGEPGPPSPGGGDSPPSNVVPGRGDPHRVRPPGE